MNCNVLSHNEPNDFIKELYLNYSEQIYTYLLTQTFEPNIAKDILQEVFLIAIQKKETLEQSPNQLGWLYKTAKYCVYRQWSTEKRENQLMCKLSAKLQGESNLCCEQELFEDSELFYNLKQYLNEKEYRYICNRFLYDMSLKKIAADENKSVSAVTSFGNRVFKKIRAAYNQRSKTDGSKKKT
ncbi:RNA polymerase sigma factor [Anaerotignum lactatifermentans]|uniref:RNA polymerase sigma factor n=1 Tax=Anaerotignum lactatifermentans TaxID=160404 RepID=UPI0017481859|nr:sigma-70 family RNA polymerase sigma factor [Anaerotignum lactatifermentans]